jgi:hypothetical protein
MDLRQSENYAKYMQSLGWTVDSGAFVKKLWFTAIVKIQHGLVNLARLKKYHPFLIKLEPLVEINLPGFKKDNWPLIPSKTIILDLKNITLSKDVRYEMRKSDSIDVKESQDPEAFYRLLQETMKIGHWEIPIKKEVINLWKSFQPDNSVILMSPISGCLLVWSDNTAHYMFAALTREGRKVSAAYSTLWEAIKFCQKKGLRFLDLEGIYDDRYPGSTKNWKGFTAFKKQWGGKIVEYPGSYSRYLFPFNRTTF